LILKISNFHNYTIQTFIKTKAMFYQVKLVIETTPSFGDGSGVGQHADGALNLGEVTSGDNCRWLETLNWFSTLFSISHDKNHTMGNVH
jgi:hypothetical protein